MLVLFAQAPPEGVVAIACGALQFPVCAELLHPRELVQRIVVQPHLAAVGLRGLRAVAVRVVAVVGGSALLVGAELHAVGFPALDLTTAVVVAAVRLEQVELGVGEVLLNLSAPVGFLSWRLSSLSLAVWLGQPVARRIQTLALAALALAISMGHTDQALLGVVLVSRGISRRLHTDELAQSVVAVAASREVTRHQFFLRPKIQINIEMPKIP